MIKKMIVEIDCGKIFFFQKLKSFGNVLGIRRIVFIKIKFQIF
jgi:hypothetical protein